MRALRPTSGHGRVWAGVLPPLARRVRFVRRFAQVRLADGHGDLPRGRSPLCVELHEAPWDDPSALRGVDPRLVEALRARGDAAVRAAASVVTLSEHARGEIVRCHGADPARVVVAHPGVEHRVFRPAGPRARPVEDRPYVLFVGALHPRKNLVALREAMAGLGAALVVVGGPPGDRDDPSGAVAAALAPLSSGQPVVRVAAPDDVSLAALMRGAVALCLPSFSEGFGLPVAEAMACGTPVVVSDRGALPEVVGEAGIVVQPDAAALRGALGSLLEDASRRAAVGRACRERAARYTWEACAERWERALRLAVA